MNLNDLFRFNERWGIWFSHAMVALMMVCVAISFADLGHSILPGWNGVYLPLVCFFVSLEAFHSFRTTHKMNVFEKDWIIYRVTEWVVILVGLKVLLYILDGFAQLPTDIQLWRENFILGFFTEEFVLHAVIIFLIWVLSRGFANALYDLEGDELILAAADREELFAINFNDRTVVHRQLMGWVFTLGIALVFLTGLARLDYRAILSGQPIPRVGVLNVVFYFIFGLALLGQSHFATLRASWSFERIPISRNMVSQWIVYSLFFLLLVSVLAFIMPTRFTSGFLPAVSAMINFLFALIVFLVSLLIFPIIALMMLILQFLGVNQSASPPKPPVLPKIVTEPATAVSSPLFEVLKTLVFWAVFVGVIVYAFYQYAQRNQALMDRLRQIKGWLWLEAFWRWLRGQVRIWQKNIAVVVQAGLNRLRVPAKTEVPAERWGFLNLRKLSPRQRVLFFYLALVRRGGEVGTPRSPSQTPFEYAHTIRENVPEADPDLEEITEAFVEARYSRHEVTGERASLIQRAWEHIRRALRRRKPEG